MKRCRRRHRRRFVLPSGVELAILGTCAVLAAAVFASLSDVRPALVALVFPLVLTSMLMGARRNGHLGSEPETLPIQVERAPGRRATRSD